MKIIEATDFFVRVVVFDFKHKDPAVKLKFRVIPMFHIGTPSYYQKAFQYLNECQTVFYEGLKFSRLKYIFKTHSRMAKQLNLVTQKAVLPMKSLQCPLIHADLDETSALDKWKEIHWWKRLKFCYWTPLSHYFISHAFNRHLFSRSLMEGCQQYHLAYGPSRDRPHSVENFIFKEREQIVFSKIEKHFDAHQDKEGLAGIIYGAAHMNAITRYLIDKMDYIPTSAEYLSVFAI